MKFHSVNTGRIITFFISALIILSLVSCDNATNETNNSVNAITTTGKTEETTSLFTTTAAEPEEPVVNEDVKTDDKYISIKDTGAIGDGVTDDTDAIQTAFDTMEGGGTIYFPSGTYKVTKSLKVNHSNINIKGNDKTTHIIFYYDQKGIDNYSTASLFVFKPRIENVVFCDMKLEYVGEFFPEFGQSYNGKVNGLYFKTCNNVLVENVEIFGFNANAILVGDALMYSQSVKINKSYLHHNRVAGVLYGNVDGISITDCDLEYMGSQPDGGTGYGCAGSSGAIPKNIQVIGNRANYNYRKGIDLHAGFNAIVQGNICKGNRLYGIYAEGINTGDIIIRNNIVTGMQREKLDIGSPYTWICGITVGVWQAGDDTAYHNYVISGNIINDFGLTEGDAYPIFVYHSNRNGSIQIKDNILNVGDICHLVRFSRNGEKASSYDISIDISGNQMTSMGNVKNSPIYTGYYNKLNVSNNQIVFKKAFEGYILESSNLDDCQIFYNFNNITAPGYDKDELSVIRHSDKVKVIKSNNILNGELTE